MIDLEHIPRYEDGLYVLRFTLDNYDVGEIRQIFNDILKALQKSNIDTPLLAIPSDILLQKMSVKELKQIRDIIDKSISNLN